MEVMKIVVKTLNYAGYLIGCKVLGDYWYKAFYGLFGFITDETYAEEHPKMYLAKLVGVMVAGILLALAIIWYPLTKLMELINSKIENFFKKEKKDDEDDDWLD